MILVNWFILIYYVIVCSASKSVICDMNLAYAFLWRSGGLPKKTVTLSLEVFGLYGLLCVLIFNKESVYRRSLTLRVLICAAEIILSAALVWSLNYYYSGIALLVLADLLWHEQKKETRVFFIVVQVLEFVIGNDEILSYFQSNISFAQYLSNFRPAVRSWLIGVESVMTFANIFLFFLFILLMVIGLKNENSRILQLNSALSRKNFQLHDANVKLQEYSKTIKRMTEIKERNRLAREIHDTLGHTLTGIVVSADAGKILMDVAPEEAKTRFDVIGENARQCLEDVRRSIRALRPDALEDQDLESALDKMIGNFREATGARILFEQNAGDLCLAQDEEETVYRIVQEGLTNAIRHGKATEIELTIERKDRDLCIRITDNGIGMKEESSGFGLDYMRERVEMLKGSLSFGNRRDNVSGFVLEAEIPVRGVKLEEDE